MIRNNEASKPESLTLTKITKINNNNNNNNSEEAGDSLSSQYASALASAESTLSSRHSPEMSSRVVASRLASRNESLQLTVDSLKEQLERYKGIARDKISGLYEDRNVREQQVRFSRLSFQILCAIHN